MKTVRFRTSSGTALLLLALVGCGKSVALDHPGTLIPSADPSVLGTLQERVVELRVDNERLYWLSDQAALRSCEKQRCASSVVTYTEHGGNPFAGFSVQGGELFYAQAGNPGDLLAIDVADPTLTRILATGVDALGLATDNDAVYVADSGGQILVFALAAKLGDPPISIPASPGSVMSAKGDYVYWFDLGEDGTRVSISRARKDASAAAEVLAADVKVDWSVRSGGYRDVWPSLGLVVDDSYVYWGENLLVGAIKRLSVTGGSAAPETVVAPIRFPMALWLDGSTLYVEHERDAYEYAVSGCPLDSCQPQVLANGLEATNVFAVDDEYLYTATSSQSQDPDVLVDHPVTQLRRTSKKIGRQP